ncbi:MAG: hypothetical protein JWO61_155 [Candidatus Saccharibacteria bacterium]|nr:hypothetical protein [Candidatus Saccharibacteria bacterium]
MASKQTIIINGKHYDTQTGMPVEAPTEEVVPVSVPQTQREASANSSRVHASLQKSKTLNRKIVHKQIPVTSPRPQTSSPKHMDISRSPSISRFAPHPVVTPVVPSDHIAPATHPFVHKANQATGARVQQTSKTSQVLKNEAIAQALNTPAKKHVKQSVKRRFPRVFSISTASLAIFLLAGYLSYLNMPTISIRVAAVQSGINATYPDYHPSGYRLSGPIAYNDGEVHMRFAANAGPQNFTIKEQRSNWNSSAVLENYVQPKTENDYSVHTQSGLTIYTYGNNAAWANGGILYTIEGNAPLSNDQVLRIATSL